MFKKAARKKLKLRMALCSPAGYGKTYTALRLAGPLANGGKIAVIDTEHGAASKYAGMAPDGTPWVFDVCELQHFAPSAYTAALRDAAAAGYPVVIIDSLSHAWSGVGGALDQVDKKAAGGGNSFTAWKDVTPQHNELVETILAYPGHVITTMRTKQEFVLEEEDRKGRKVMVPKKVGMKPVQREGMDYEFDVVADLDESHTLIVNKTRCPAIDGQRVTKPGPEFVTPILKWLGEGDGEMEYTPPPFQPSQPVAAPPQPATPPTSTAKRCSDIQRQTILDMTAALGITGEPYQKMLEKRGAKKLEDLTEEQALEILCRLKERTTKQKAELDQKLAEIEKAKPAKTASSPAETAEDAAGSIDPTHLLEIPVLCGHLAFDAGQQKSICNKRPLGGNGRPCQTWNELSYRQGKEVFDNLQVAIQKKFPDGIPF